MVRALEVDLGISLFRRVGRSVELTSVGAAYYPQVVEALDLIAAATRSVRGMNGGNVLSIAVLPTLAMRHLVPSLRGFQQQHPDLLVDLISKDGPIDFTREHVDVAICYGSGRWSGVEATLLLNEVLGVFCSPAFAKHGASLREPADLPQHHLLIHSTRPDAWAEYLAAFDITIREPERAAGFEHFFMVIEAAVAGAVGQSRWLRRAAREPKALGLE